MGAKRPYKLRKPGGGRKKLKPEFDARENLKEQMDVAVALYEECSLQDIADALVLNPIKVRKLLITDGVYESCGLSRLPCPCRPESRKRNTCAPASASCSPCRSILPCRQVLRVTNTYVLSFCVSSYMFRFLRGGVPRSFLCLDVLLLLATRFIWNNLMRSTALATGTSRVR